MRDHPCINEVNLGAGKCGDHRARWGQLLSKGGSGKARERMLTLRPGGREGSQEKAWEKEQQKQKPCDGKGLDLSTKKQGQGGRSPAERMDRPEMRVERDGVLGSHWKFLFFSFFFFFFFAF